MKMRILTTLPALIGLVFYTAEVAAEQPNLGTEEFGLTPKQLVEAIEKIEVHIATCMRNQGFTYIANDYATIRKGMSADKILPGMSEADFIQRYGFGISTFYSGKPPQLSEGYSPARIGLGQRNIDIFKNLSPADQVAYNRTLFGDNMGESLAVSIEGENFSRTGGCTREGISQVFSPDELKATYYNPKDALVNKDPRIKKALRKYVEEMRSKGFDYNHPDEVEPDVRERLAALTNNGTLQLSEMTPDQIRALKRLQTYERRAAAMNFYLSEEIFDPVEEEIEKEMFSRQGK
jgi:hypothetical protein